jgi:hypothetical protein
MTEATLQIEDPNPFHRGDLLTYDSALFAVEKMQRKSRIEDGELKKGKVTVHVRSSSMLGVEVGQDAAVREQLPGGWHRCRLVADGREILNGSVHGLYGISTGAGAGGAYTWSLRLEDQALEDLLRMLENTRMDASVITEAIQPDDYISMSTHLGEGTSAERRPWTRPVALWNRLIEELTGVTQPEPLDGLFPLSVSAQDPDTGEIIEHSYSTDPVLLDSTRPSSTTLPSLTGKDYFDVLRAAQGARLFAGYADFPSDAIEVTLRPGGWSDEEGLQELTPESGGYDWTTRKPGEEGYALRYENEPPKHKEYVGQFDEDFSALDALPTAPALYAEAGGGWHLSADGESDDRSAEKIGLTLPGIPDAARDYKTYPDGYEEAVMMGKPRVTPASGGAAGQDGGTVYIAAAAQNDSDNYRAVEWREVLLPAAGQPDHVSELWPASLMARQELKAVPMRQVKGTFREPDTALAPGVFSEGASLEGLPYLAEELSADVRAHTIDATLIRPARRLSDPALSPTGPPAALETNHGYYRTRSEATSDVSWISWADPAGAAPADAYQIQQRNINDESGGEWTDWADHPEGRINMFQMSRLQWRIRSIYRWAPNSDWVYTEEIERQ